MTAAQLARTARLCYSACAHRLRRHPPEHVAVPSPGAPTVTARRIHTHFAGRNLELLLRPNTSDETLVNMILHREGEYALPGQVHPRVIVDVGANIGIATVFFACLYPRAEIYSFEPLPENVVLLRRNVAAFGQRIHILPFGLSDSTQLLPYHMSEDPTNFGGGTFRALGHDAARSVDLPLRHAAEALSELDVSVVDVFKLDTEGSEWPILRALPEGLRTRAQAFVGELHGCDDWKFCDLLAPSHALQISKPLAARCFHFLALRRDLLR